MPPAPLTLPAPTLLDRTIMAVAPEYGARRYRARVAMTFAGQYAGAKSNKTALKAWRTFAGSADADALGDLPALRARSRDLRRNNPIAAGAGRTGRAHTVGAGLAVRSTINRDILGLSVEQANAWERKTETLFDLWARSKSCDVSMKQNFYQLQGLIFDAVWDSGDCLILRRKPKTGAVVPLALSVIEADRIATPHDKMADPDVRSGVRVDDDGMAVAFYVLHDHPGDFVSQTAFDYTEVQAYGKNSGERMALHVYQKHRPYQTRGVPELAPIIEILKQLDRYSEAEIMAAVVSSFFTVFIKTRDNSALPDGEAIPGMQTGADEVVMGPGAVMNIGTDEDVVTANPGRTNSNFDAFFSAIVRQIGVALGIPYELLIMHFTASYTASRAAIEIATKFFAERRDWIVSDLCDPVYEWFVSTAILSGLIEAPGFFESPARRAAWLGTNWIPPTGLVLDPVKEWEGDKAGIDLGATTLEEVTLKRTGGDWKAKTEQRSREHAARVAVRLEPPVLGVKPEPAERREPAPSDPKRN